MDSPLQEIITAVNVYDRAQRLRNSGAPAYVDGGYAPAELVDLLREEVMYAEIPRKTYKMTATMIVANDKGFELVGNLGVSARQRQIDICRATKDAKRMVAQERLRKKLALKKQAQ
jgi:hypothetical protein